MKQYTVATSHWLELRANPGFEVAEVSSLVQSTALY